MGKIVLVTGSAKGIGRACILEFAKAGYDVVINYLNSESKAKELKELVEKKYGVRALNIKADVSNEEEVKHMIDDVICHFGKIDVLVNNAAYVCDNYYYDKTAEEFLKVLCTNVIGPFLVTKYAIKYMDNGVVINVSSMDAEDTFTELSMDYCASKASLNSLTKTFSIANTNNKFISVMLPWVRTEAVLAMYPEYLKEELERTGQKRLLEPDEVAHNFINYLCDDTIKSGSILRMEVK